MSNSSQNVNVRKLHGKFGDQIVYKTRYGKSYAADVPAPSTHGPTETQSKIRLKFKMASIWAKAVLADPAKLALYKALARVPMTPWMLAMTNYLRPPKVEEIDLSEYSGHVGDQISVTAVDTTNVKSVSVTIKDNTGAVLETGACQPDDIGLFWIYTATTEIARLSGVVVSATAKNEPKHTGSLSVTIA